MRLVKPLPTAPYHGQACDVQPKHASRRLCSQKTRLVATPLSGAATQTVYPRRVGARHVSRCRPDPPPCRVVKKVPELQEQFVDKAAELLNDRNQAVLLCGVSLMLQASGTWWRGPGGAHVSRTGGMGVGRRACMCLVLPPHGARGTCWGPGRRAGAGAGVGRRACRTCSSGTWDVEHAGGLRCVRACTCANVLQRHSAGLTATGVHRYHEGRGGEGVTPHAENWHLACLTPAAGG